MKLTVDKAKSWGIKNLVGVIDFLYYHNEKRRFKVIDESKSVAILQNSFTLWQNHFATVGTEAFVHRLNFSLSMKRSLLEPLSGVTNVYLCFAALLDSLGMNVTLFIQGERQREFRLSENVKIELVKTNPTLANGIPGGTISKWNSTIESSRNSVGADVIIGPNVNMEFFPFGEDKVKVLTLHTDWLTDPKNNRGFRKIKRSFMKEYYKLIYADIVVSNSNSHLKNLGSFLPKRAHIESIPHIVHSISESTIACLKSDRLKNIIHLGKTDSRKGCLELANAWMSSKAHQNGWKLLFVGPKGNEHHSLEKLARKSKGIEVCGEVSEDEKKDLLLRASFVCVPSVYESFSLVALEALMLGVQVVCRDLPTLRETTENKAIYFANEEQLVSLLGNLDSLLIPQKLNQETNSQKTDVFVENWRNLVVRCLQKKGIC